jgi:carboxypeptidase C (cathepsin A)
MNGMTEPIIASFGARMSSIQELSARSRSPRQRAAAIVRCGLLALVLVGVSEGIHAQDPPARGSGDQDQQRGDQQRGSVLRLLPADAVTEHTIDLADRKLAYTATAGTLSLFDQNGQRSAAVFYTAYVAKDVERQTRPLTFVFNGGPGAASAYLHLGLVGPKVLDFGSQPSDWGAARLHDNPDSWLDFTDLVLIDPVGTGWSRAAKPDGASAFWGVRQDAETIAKVIALYVANNSRGSSPKYLLGESYGGFRAAKVARTLQHDQGIGLAGIVMVSPMLEGALQFGGDRLALGAALHLPTLVATELERNHAFTEQALADAEHFALGEYLSTLAGPEPTGEAAHEFYARVAGLTGLPEDVVAKSRGFIRNDYVKALRAGDRKIVSAYDATIAVADPYPESTQREVDPILDGFTRAYGGAFVNYARDELGFKTEITYILLNGEVSGKWEWNDRGGRSPPTVSDDLRVLLALDPSFRLLIANGRSDMVTPYAANRYVLDHLPRTLTRGRSDLRLYRGGHMFYINPQSRHGFSADARSLFQPSR